MYEASAAYREKPNSGIFALLSFADYVDARRRYRRGSD